ncbi:MAG: putative Carboxylesterase [bacterium]|nr:putative Carboxylesterase [bacterium]
MSERQETIELGGLRAISVGDPDAAKVVMVLAHGFQMEPADLSPFAHSIRAPAWFLFPEAPRDAEPRGRAWWFIDPKLRDEALRRGPRDFAGQHPPDLPAARARLQAFLQAAKAAAGVRPLVIGGFSQGGMLTCDTLLRSELDVAAMVLLSASRIAFDEWEPLLTAGRLRGLPVLVSHGETDPDLAFSAGEALRDCLAAAGADVTWLPFGQGHEIPLVVWRRLRTLLLQW